MEITVTHEKEDKTEEERMEITITHEKDDKTKEEGTLEHEAQKQ